MTGNVWGLTPQEPIKQTEPMRIMQLYYCPECGQWADRALRDSIEQAAHSLADGIVRAFGGTPPQREVLPALMCPEGHGEMVLVKATDRIAIIQEEVNER